MSINECNVDTTDTSANGFPDPCADQTQDDQTTDEKSCWQKRLQEWAEIENIVIEYQKQFTPGASEYQIEISKEAAAKLLDKFYPVIKKYQVLIKSGKIDFKDPEMRSFVSSFIDSNHLKNALANRISMTGDYQQEIYKKFYFVKESYGYLQEDEIMVDLQVLLLALAQRYKDMGRHFCAYVYNSYKFEVSRHIKKFTKNPLNIHYKNIEYEDYMSSYEEQAIQDDFEDKFYENSIGIPDISWIQGKNCSEIFSKLSNMERKLLVKYYGEEWNDRQISESFGIHINTVNQKRRQAVAKIAQKLGIPENEIKRNRKSGKKAILPTSIQ